MRTLIACLVALVTVLLSQACAQSILFEATTGRPYYSFMSTWLMGPTSVIQQPFTATLDRIEVVELGLVLRQPDSVELRVREDNDSGTILASHRLVANSLGEFGRLRVTFTNAVPVTPGAGYILELTGVAPVIPWPQPNYFFYPEYPRAAVRGLRFDGILHAGMAMDFGVGVFVPDVLPPDRSVPTYVEQSPPIPLASDAVLTNLYTTNYSGTLLEIRSPLGASALFGADLAIQGVFGSALYLDDVVIGSVEYLTPFPAEEVFRIRFNSRATAAALQQILHSIVYSNSRDWPARDVLSFPLLLSNAVGEVNAILNVQIVPVNDPPLARLELTSSGTFWPKTNLYVFTPRRRGPASIVIRTDGSTDPDSGLAVTLTYEEDPDWEFRGAFVLMDLSLGLHHMTLSVNDGQYTNTVTSEFKVITVAQGLNLLKKSVRATARGRDRLRLLKPLVAAQCAYSRRSLRTVKWQLEHFIDAAFVGLSQHGGASNSWIDAASGIGNAIVFCNIYQ